jgi:anti-sigma28 factor (negative regulator of flagellin synthesis)
MVDPVNTQPVRLLRGGTDYTTSVKPTRDKAEIAISLKSPPRLANLLQLSRELSEQGPPFDHARVTQIRQAIADQSLVIDARAIANAIVTFGLDQKS